MGSLAKQVARLLRWMAPIRKSTQEAAEQQLAKQAKLTTFNGLTFENDLKQLAEADRESVARWRADKMGINPNTSSGQNKDAWVCDDMTINNSGGEGWKMLAVLGLLALGAWWCMNQKQQISTPQPSVGDMEYEVIVYDKDGNVLNVLPYSEYLKQKAVSQEVSE